MALRVYTDREGDHWNVWHVRPTTAPSDSPLHPRFRDGWVCFQREDGTGRCRLPLDEVPDDWENLPDDRLDLLRRVAEQAVNTGTPDSTTEQARRSLAEDRARNEVSGPRAIAGHDERRR